MRALALALAALVTGCAASSPHPQPSSALPSAPDARRAGPPRGSEVPASLVTAAGARAGVDVWALTGPCPVEGSPGWRDDLAVLLWVQEARTPDQVRRAASAVELGPEALAEEAGRPLDAARRPLTRALLADAEREARSVYGPLKAHCDRPRPYAADARLAPAVEKEPSAAFPSGHATRGALYARLLAELAPARAALLAERGRQIGFDRVRAGVHWPSDVEAGQRLGIALAEESSPAPSSGRGWRRRGRRSGGRAPPPFTPALSPGGGEGEEIAAGDEPPLYSALCPPRRRRKAGMSYWSSSPGLNPSPLRRPREGRGGGRGGTAPPETPTLTVSRFGSSTGTGVAVIAAEGDGLARTGAERRTGALAGTCT